MVDSLMLLNPAFLDLIYKGMNGYVVAAVFRCNGNVYLCPISSERSSVFSWLRTPCVANTYAMSAVEKSSTPPNSSNPLHVPTRVKRELKYNHLQIYYCI